jgi:hypothetical protein
LSPQNLYVLQSFIAPSSLRWMVLVRRGEILF